jgi:hypothetical protein
MQWFQILSPTWMNLSFKRVQLSHVPVKILEWYVEVLLFFSVFVFKT